MDEVIAALAERQHGVVARRQLVDQGIGNRSIEHRLERGRLWAVDRGIYAPGHRILSQHARWMVAVLAGGPGAVLSHRAGAALWTILRSSRRREEVTVDRNRRSRPGVEFHRARLPSDEVRSWTASR